MFFPWFTTSTRRPNIPFLNHRKNNLSPSNKGGITSPHIRAHKYLKCLTRRREFKKIWRRGPEERNLIKKKIFDGFSGLPPFSPLPPTPTPPSTRERGGVIYHPDNIRTATPISPSAEILFELGIKSKQMEEYSETYGERVRVFWQHWPVNRNGSSIFKNELKRTRSGVGRLSYPTFYFYFSEWLNIVFVRV